MQLYKRYSQTEWGGWKKYLQDFFPLLTFYLATAFFFRSFLFAWIVILSLGFHEVGHAVMIARYGLKFRISFGIVGAWTWSPLTERERLTEIQNISIHLAGPLFSILLAILAVFLKGVFQWSGEDLLLMANLNVQIAMLNLLPFGSLTDGGKVVRRVIQSQPQQRRLWFAAIPLVFVVFWALIFWKNGWIFWESGVYSFLVGFLLLFCWMIGSLLLEIERARNREYPVLHPLAPVQAVWVTTILWGSLLFCLVFTALTPFWLSPKYIMGSYENANAILQFLANLFLF